MTVGRNRTHRLADLLKVLAPRGKPDGGEEHAHQRHGPPPRDAGAQREQADEERRHDEQDQAGRLPADPAEERAKQM